MSEPGSIERARDLDRHDPLREYRDRFVIEDPHQIYMDGNSLGRLPKEAVATFDLAIRKQWGERLVRSWNEGWYRQSLRLGKKIAQIVGAAPDEVVVCDNTSTNLYKLAYGALKIKEGRKEIISDDMNFPTDLYILQGLIEQFGRRHTLRLLKSPDGISSDMTELLRMINRDTALLSLSHVAFKSAYMYDMPKVTELAHMHGALMLWDLSHSVGAVPVGLGASGADLAVGCTYKYLNGGPGAPAFLYVRRELQEQMVNPVQGWFGEYNPFEFRMNYRPAGGIQKFMTGTPPVISLGGLEPAMELILEAGIESIRRKSIDQSEYLISLAEDWLYGEGIRLGSPALGDRRGSHVTLKHAEAYRICKALLDPEVGDCVVIPDFREPNNLRFALTPLYTSYEEIHRAMDKVKIIMELKLYERYARDRSAVT